MSVSREEKSSTVSARRSESALSMKQKQVREVSEEELEEQRSQIDSLKLGTRTH